MFANSKPYVRWWWLGGPFREEDIARQLDWLKDHGFGGVELAWIYPLWAGERMRRDIPEWLGEEWSRLVGFTKAHADAIGLGCDFTFGSVWPFGGRCVPEEEASQTFDGTLTPPLHASWEEATDGAPGRVLDHLSAQALRNYARVLAPAFASGLRGSKSALFCDSLEIPKRRLWSPRLWQSFEERFGYSLREMADHLERDPDVRYDYRKFVGETIVREFYDCFTRVCHELGALSRVQCHGAPADLLSAYAVVDIPESEALLFNPHFSRIPASAAALTGKAAVSCETFTCIYGIAVRGNLKPFRYWRREQVADLKLLADALFANGVNQMVWHGMPFNPPGGEHEFFASVHVGPDCAFSGELTPFNAYLETVSAALRQGTPCCRLAVYLPNEDYMMLEESPGRDRIPGEQDLWEMRTVTVPPETEGYHPLWISEAFLRRAEVTDGRLHAGQLVAPALYVDVDWLDADALRELLRLARKGLHIVLKGQPRQPGRAKSPAYERDLEALRAVPSVVETLGELDLPPLLAGGPLPWFWAREVDDGLVLFVAHPRARKVVYPMGYGESLEAQPVQQTLILNHAGKSIRLNLDFRAFESLLVRVDGQGGVSFIELGYHPPTPVPDRDDFWATA